jgi:TP901 family phage tail tape measure protein
MNGSDDSMVKIIQSLGLDYKPAEQSIKSFEARIASLNKQLFDMKANAIQGARDINQAFSSQLGSLGGGKVLVDQWGQPLKTIQTEAAKVGTGIVDGFKPATQAAQEHGQSVQAVAKQYNIFDSEMQRRVSWFMTGGLFYGTLKAAKETVQTISEVEMGMIEIARVMDDSSFVFKDYRDELLQLGVDYGQTFDTVQNIALRWAQSGYNVRDSLELTKTSLLALNTAELDAKYATEGMIGIMSQWQLTAEDLLPVIDKINKTADDYAVTSQDLVDGLLRSSSAAKIMNLSIDETISLLTVMREASGRTGREVGNALNSILSYIQRPGSIKVLESLGIRVFADEARTQFRNVMGLFKDIAANWQTTSASIQDGFVKSADDAGLFNEELATALGLQKEWNDLQQRDIAQASAGVYRRNYFIGMIERLSNAQGVLNNMMDSSGYSIRENERTMEGLAKKYESLKAAAQELAVALGDAGLLDTLKGIVDAGTNAAQAFARMDDNAKALVLTALELVAAVKTLQSVVALFTTKGVIGVARMLPVWGQVAAVIAAVAGAAALFTYNMKQANAQTLEDIRANEHEIEKTNDLIEKYKELEEKVNKSQEEKDKLLDIQKQLAAIYPDYVDSLDDEGNKLITNVELLREVVALKREELELKRQDAIADARRKIPSLIRQREQLQRKMEESQQRLDTGDTLVTIEEQGQRFVFDERNKIRKDLLDLQQQRFKLDQEIKSLSQVMSSGIDYVDYERWLPRTPTGGGVVDDGVYEQGAVGVTGTSAATNEALRNALRVLEHRKRMNQISIADEIEYLNNIRNLYITNADELMDINERIYDAQNRLIDSTFKNSTDWINEQKSLGLMSAAEEIEAWERVYKNQKGNAEAQKQATLNLYKLRNQVMTESFNMEERSIKHLSKLGVYSIEQQIEKYRELYDVKVKDLAEEQTRVENLFELYKKLISDQQKTIKTAHDKRIEQIEEEARKKKEVNEAEIKAIEAELDLLNKREQAYDHDKRMANLKEELAYWQVRTSEQARQKVADILKQIDEEEHNREVELKKQGLEDKKKVLQDEIKSIDDTAKKEREKWEKSYKQIEIRFDDHSINMIALASAMSKGMFDEFKRNYLDKIEDAIKSGDYDSIGGILDGVDDYAEEARRKTYDSTNAQVYRLASQILDFKRQYEYGGDTSAAQMAKSYYDELSRLSPNVADMLHRSNYMTAKKYVESLPRAHSGGKTLSYGAVYMKPGELIFPPDLSIKLDGLLDFLKASPAYRSSANSYAYDNSKRVNIDKLLNIERNYNEDKTDIEIWARELRRAVIAI